MTKRAFEPSADESALIEQAKSDHDAFGQLYERYAQRIYQYIYYRTSSEADAEDLAAKTFMRAWQHMATYDDRGVPFSAPLSCLAIGLAQSVDIMAPLIGADAPDVGWVCANADSAAEAKRTEAMRVRIDILTEEQVRYLNSWEEGT